MFVIRPATFQDCALIWRWANDPTVRQASFSAAPIPWADHEQWFTLKLADPNCRLFIAEENDRPIGQVRFEIADDQAEVHIAVSADARGLGYGTRLLSEACRRIFSEERPVQRVVAHVKPDNAASLRLFERVGFVRSGGDMRYGHVAERLILQSTG